ncbi:armadillo-type protein [Hyaloraphidium curvatum]|nr:armadillo-type protein [Hyaloraphidium curvatum]
MPFPRPLGRPPLPEMTIPLPDEVNALSLDFAALEETLQNTSQTHPLGARFRALFGLRSFRDKRAVDAIAKAFSDSSVLLKHELAYVLGQMRNPAAIPPLCSVLKDVTEDPMVRHEAAEALGAIGDPSALETLKHYLSDSSDVVAQTCELAIRKIEYEAKNPGSSTADSDQSPYLSEDPAPAFEGTREVPELRSILLDTSQPLFERYRAMFSLRNMGGEEAVLALAAGLNDSSALFRHEIAYIFGQMQHPASVPALIERLSDTAEVAMVRHECAEALGSIATDECRPVLAKFAADGERVVRESCIVGIDMME